MDIELCFMFCIMFILVSIRNLLLEVEIMKILLVKCISL